MPNRPNHGTKPTGIRPKGRYAHTHGATPARHYYSNTSHTWRNPTSARESRYSDFVPSTYDEHTLLTRLYKYARDFLAQTNGTILLRSPIAITRSSSGSSGHSTSDIEMITSSPSPTLHTSTKSCSPRSYDSSYRFTTAPSPRAYIKPPPPAAFPRYVCQSPTTIPNPLKRPLSTSSTTKVTVDAGTQYSPPAQPIPSAVDPPKSSGKRKAMPSPPRPPPEPALEPQTTSTRPAPAPPASENAAESSSDTLAQSSSSCSHGSSQSSPKRQRPPKPTVKLMPLQYETCDVKDLVLMISNLLLELVRFNDNIPLKDGRLTRFHSRAPPGISVKDYLQRLTTHATLSPPILLSMVYYIDRLCALYPAFTISSLTVHRFLITSATVASKGLSDSFWTNNTYARVGGVSIKELALLELEFLWRVEWRIVPKPEVLVDYYNSLVERSEGYKLEGEPRIDGGEIRGEVFKVERSLKSDSEGSSEEEKQSSEQSSEGKDKDLEKGLK